MKHLASLLSPPSSLSSPSLGAALRTALLALALLTAWAGALGAQPGAAFTGPIGTLTIVDGGAQIVRGTLRFKAAEGQRLQAEDLVMTDPKARLLRVEFSDGGVLDLGAATQAQLQPRPLGERSAAVYLARGWAKLALPAGQAGPGIASARLDLARLGGAAVMRVDAERSFVFVESGQAEVIERQPGNPVRNLGLRDGESFVLRAEEAGSLLARPNAQMLQDLPRAFADQLPRRAQRFQALQTETGTALPVSYADVAIWLNGEAALRPAFVRRFSPLATERPFRVGLLAELRSHPEWARVLFPEKARAKATALARRRAGAAAIEAAVSPAEAPPPPASMVLNALPFAAALAQNGAERAN